MKTPDWLKLDRERLAAAQREYDSQVKDADDEDEPDWEQVAAAHLRRIGELEELRDSLEKKVDDADLRWASFLDLLNTFLREEYPHPAPQAEMEHSGKDHLVMLVARLRVKLDTERSRQAARASQPQETSDGD